LDLSDPVLERGALHFASDLSIACLSQNEVGQQLSIFKPTAQLSVEMAIEGFAIAAIKEG
jgi:hypothetical protein